MKIGYPEKNGSKEDLKFTNSYGKYLISHFNTWHGGIHLEGAKKAIQTIAKGRIIAYRLQEKYEVLKGTQKASKKKYTYSNSFILMQHDLELTKEVQTKEETDKVEKKQVTFYSLYNHLMPLKEQEKLGLPFPDFISKEELKVIKKERYDSSFKKAGLNGRVLNAAGKVQRGASGVKVIIPYGTIVQKYKDTAGNFVTENSYTRVVYEDETGTIYDDIYIYTKKGKVKKEGEGYRINTKEDFPTDKGARVREAPGKAITAIIPYNETVEIVKKEGNWYRIKGYEGVSHKGNFEKRKILNTKAFTKNAITASDIPVESGICIGYTGAMHGENTPWYCASQLDVFMTEGVEDFLKNTFGATVTGKNFITLPEGTKLKEKLSVSVKLEKNLPVKIVEIRGNYAKINVPKFVDKIVDKRDLYTPNKSSADGKMRGYNRIRGYHILNFENINKRFDGLLIEGESKLFCHGLRNSKVQRKVKYYPKEGGKKGYWVPLDALSKNVVYEEKEEVREVPKRLNVFEGLLDYIVTQDRTVQKKVKVSKAVKVPIAKNQKVLLNRFIDTAYLEVSKKDEEEELYKEVVVDLRGAKECMVKKKKYLKVRCSYTIGNDSYKQEGWIPAKGLEKKAFNGYHWERFGFELVDGGKEYMYDIKDLREASTTESRFVETMWRKLGVVEDDVLDFFELEAAYALLETQEKISKMVCKHKIEWSYTPEEIAKEVEGFYNYYIGYQRDLGEDTQKLGELKEEKLAAIKEQVSKLMFWKEASALPYGAHKEVRALGADLKMQPLSLLTSSSTEGATCFNVFDSDEEIAKKEALKKQAPKKDSVKKKQVAPARRARSKQEKQPVRKFPNTDMVYHFHPIGFVNQMRLMFPQSKADTNYEAMVRAFLRVIKEFEGVPGEQGYTTLFGKKDFFSDMSTHPEKPIYWYTKKDGTKVHSTAAGSYQIMKETWWDYNGHVVKDHKKAGRNENRNFVKKYGIKDFSPKSQDEFCIALLKHAKPGLLDKLLKGFVTQAIEEHAAHTWASFTPGRYENQGPTKGITDKQKKRDAIHNARVKQWEAYDKYLGEELAGQSDLHLEPGFLKKFGIKEPEAQELIENKKEGLDLNKAIEGLNKRAGANDTAVGKCAKYVRWALENGGMKTWGATEIEQRPNYACNYGPFLLHKGFIEVSNGDYKKGDIVVIESFSGHKAGHIQMYNGKNWVSDFIQNYFYPGRAYRKAEPNYKTYRWE